MRTSPYYPQSNGKVERFHGTIKKECIRKKALLDQDHANIIIGSYITFYNNQRLHGANAYIAPADQWVYWLVKSCTLTNYKRNPVFLDSYWTTILEKVELFRDTQKSYYIAKLLLDIS